MTGSFGLRSKAQFQSLDQYKGQWLVVKEQPAAQQRFLELIDALWPRNNYAPDEEEDPAPWNLEALDPDRARQLEYHCMAARQLASLDSQFLPPESTIPTCYDPCFPSCRISSRHQICLEIPYPASH